ncbi:MAG: GNAT family acetyltransferase [Hyphomicrobiales bacterium]|nr:MAG: GNAT family acetyltransferase [Hyphomicrobiales bacterium]
MSDTLTIRPMCDADEADVIRLWQDAGLTRPFNDPGEDIAFARKGPASEVLVGELGGAIAASVMVGHDGHRGVVYYVSVDPDLSGRGFGRQIMAAAEDWLRVRGVWKLNLMIRAENTPVRNFYEALGYEVEERLVMARRLRG